MTDLLDANVTDLANELGLPSGHANGDGSIRSHKFMPKPGTRQWKIQPVVATTGDGVMDGLIWLSDVGVF